MPPSCAVQIYCHSLIVAFLCSVSLFSSRLWTATLHVLNGPTSLKTLVALASTRFLCSGASESVHMDYKMSFYQVLLSKFCHPTSLRKRDPEMAAPISSASPPPENDSTDFHEINITEDLKMAALYEDYLLDEEEDAWTDGTLPDKSNACNPELGQTDIRFFFRPLPKHDIRTYFHLIRTSSRPKPAGRLQVKPVVTRPALPPRKDQSYGPIMSRPRPPYPPKTKMQFEQDRAIMEQIQRSGNGHVQLYYDYPPLTSIRGWHPTWTDEGLRSLSVRKPRHISQAADLALMPRPLKSGSIRHSPTSSEDDTLVSARLESETARKSPLYGPVETLPIRLARPKEVVSPPEADPRQKQQPDTPSSSDIPNTPSAYASSEALPTDQKPPMSLQEWADEQRQKAGSKPPTLTAVPKKASKKGRSLVFRSTKKERLTAKEMVHRSSREVRKSRKIFPFT